MNDKQIADNADITYTTRRIVPLNVCAYMPVTSSLQKQALQSFREE